MQRIVELDRQLSALFIDFKTTAKELTLEEICDLSDEKTIALQNYPGIYRIDISTVGSSLDVTAWIEALRMEWEHKDFLRKFTPNFKKKRIAQHSQLLPWMPLYLGKSKVVGKRVLEHINLGLEKTTFALKIKARPSMANRRFLLHTMKLPVKNYDLIAPAIEGELRNHFHPLIGKQ